jgi:hypothetical protein
MIVAYPRSEDVTVILLIILLKETWGCSIVMADGCDYECVSAIGRGCIFFFPRPTLGFGNRLSTKSDSYIIMLLYLNNTLF